jgi:flagellar hook-length control protein FliK
MTLSDALGTAASSAHAGNLEPHSEGMASPESASFGQLMSDMLQLQTEKSSTDLTLTAPSPGLTDGQELADTWAMGAETAVPGPAWPLQEMTLGPHLNVITPARAAPDSQSLEAFARAQGLDDKAVHWLFGKLTTTTPTPTPTPTTTPMATPMAVVADSPAALATALNTANATGQPPAGVTAPLGLTAGVFLPPLGQSAAGQSATAESANTAPTAALQVAAQALAALGAMADGVSSDKKPNPNPSPSTTDSTEDGLPVQLLRMPPPAAVWMQRSLMAGVLQETATTPKGPDISESELDLGEACSPELLSRLLDKSSDSAQATQTTGTQGAAYANFAARWDAQAAARSEPAGAATPTELSSATARSENIQNLADKMGQAVGQRILSEMEKGQWHLKLQLRPATLGHIEVEMRMRSGEFDAVFTAPNAITRDLLQDGMGKLKETLAQMGMDVASIHVGNGQTGQSGGDPTPRSPQQAPAANGTNGQETAATANTRAPHVKTPQEGLDVMV